jgi:hypothetical protein
MRRPLNYSAGPEDFQRRPVLSFRIAGLIWGMAILFVAAVNVVVPFLSTMLREFKGEMPGYTKVVFKIYQEWVGSSVLITGVVAIAVIPFFLTRLVWSGGVSREEARQREKWLCMGLYLLFAVGVVLAILAVLLPYVSVIDSLGR